MLSRCAPQGLLAVICVREKIKVKSGNIKFYILRLTPFVAPLLLKRTIADDAFRSGEAIVR